MQTEKDKSAFFSDAEVYIHTAYSPNFNEPFGLSIVEAQFCGVPVVGLQSGGVSEVVYDSSYIFNDVKNMIECLRKKPYLKHKPEDIRDRAIEKFSHTTIAENYNKLFENVLNE